MIQEKFNCVYPDDSLIKVGSLLINITHNGSNSDYENLIIANGASLIKARGDGVSLQDSNGNTYTEVSNPTDYAKYYMRGSGQIEVIDKKNITYLQFGSDLSIDGILIQLACMTSLDYLNWKYCGAPIDLKEVSGPVNSAITKIQITNSTTVDLPVDKLRTAFPNLRDVHLNNVNFIGNFPDYAKNASINMATIEIQDNKGVLSNAMVELLLAEQFKQGYNSGFVVFRGNYPVTFDGAAIPAEKATWQQNALDNTKWDITMGSVTITVDEDGHKQ